MSIEAAEFRAVDDDHSAAGHTVAEERILVLHANFLECPVGAIVVRTAVSPKAKGDAAVFGVVRTADTLIPVEVDGSHTAGGVRLDIIGCTTQIVELEDGRFVLGVRELDESRLGRIGLLLLVGHPFLGRHVIDVVSIFLLAGIESELGIFVRILRGRHRGIAVVPLSVHHRVTMLRGAGRGECLAHLNPCHSV